MQKRCAFTMAEVLITLGILGIVIAMTMPMLMGEYRKKTVEVRLKKFYSAANQAIELSEVKNGPKEYWFTCTDGLQEADSPTMSCETWYNIYLKNYLNTLKVEHFDNKYQNTAAYFEDGSLMVIKSGYDIYFYPYAKDFDKDKFFQQSDDGALSRPDSGRKFFAFAFRPNSTSVSAIAYKNKGIEPYKTLYCENKVQSDGKTELVCNSLTREELLNHPRYGCNKESPYKVYCTALIQLNNWKIPDDYPFKF